MGSSDGGTEGAATLVEGPLAVNALGWKEMACRLLKLPADGEGAGDPVFECKGPKDERPRVMLRIGKGSAVDVLPSSQGNNTIVLCTRTESDACVLLLHAASSEQMDRWLDALSQCRGEALPGVTQGASSSRDLAVPFCGACVAPMRGARAPSRSHCACGGIATTVRRTWGLGPNCGCQS